MPTQTYPLISEYVEAILSAEDNFNELTHLRPVLNADKTPYMSAGNYAVVFKMQDPNTGKLYAVKCFLKDQLRRAESYKLISEELDFVQSSYLLNVRYLENELFVDTEHSESEEFPVLLMDWVEGMTLDGYLNEHIHDKYTREMLAYQFCSLASWLLSQPFAHGDIKPDNIIVGKDGSMVLVDYDGMFVPAMKGQNARELGSPDFRHPSRNESDFDEHIDDFALASIALSLKAIAIEPKLLADYGAKDRLLFSEQDYRNLSESSAWKAISDMLNDEGLAKLAGLFLVAHATHSLSAVSFRLFRLPKPEKPELTVLSTEVTEEDALRGILDGNKVLYSHDYVRLLHKFGIREESDGGYFLMYSNSNLEDYYYSVSVLPGTRVICDGAFVDLWALIKINIPNTIKAIGNEAFVSCGIRNINIPNSVISIGDEAFKDCSNLKEIFIPDSVSTIGKGAFAGCYGLESIIVSSFNSYYDSRNSCNAIIESKTDTIICGSRISTIPNTVKTIGEQAFQGCFGPINSHLIPDSVTTICNHAFWNCGLIEIFIPNSVVTIGEGAFSGCSLKKVHLPDSLTVIENNTFKWCHELTEIDIPKSVTVIGENAFESCWELKEIHIPDSVTTIKKGAFKGCRKLRRVFIPNSVTTIEDCTFEGCLNLAEIHIPDTVTSIKKSAFKDCRKLREIHIPDPVTAINDDTFNGCYELAEIHIPDRVTVIGSRAFSGCKNLSEVHIPDSVVSIEREAFYGCCNISSIHIPNTVKNIGSEAFDRCPNLKEIIIPDSVTFIGNGAFDYSNIETIKVSPLNPKYDSRESCNAIIESKTNTLVYACKHSFIPDSVTTIGNKAFSGCLGLTDLQIPNSVSTFGDSAFEGCTGLINLHIPDSVTAIGDRAFCRCDNLTNVYIPDSVLTIGEDSFLGCESLISIVVSPSNMRYDSRNSCNAIIDSKTNVLLYGCRNTIIPDTVTAIGKGAFWAAFIHNGSTIRIPDSVTSIGECAFYYCTGLTEIDIPDSVTAIGKEAFWGCSNLTNVNIPNHITVICDGTFDGCCEFTDIHIPDSVTTIGNNAFSSCFRLTKLYIPNSVTTIKDGAFMECALEEIHIPDSVKTIGNNVFDEEPRFRFGLWKHSGYMRCFIPKKSNKSFISMIEKHFRKENIIFE